MNRDSLAEALPKEQARCRELVGTYRKLGPLGVFGVMSAEQALQQADRAVASGDVVAMVQAYKDLKDCQ